MPSKSAKQHRFMQAVAHNPKFAKKAGVPQSVGREYVSADTGRFAGGGKVSNLGSLVERYLSDLKASTGLEPRRGQVLVSKYEPYGDKGSAPYGTSVFNKHLFSVRPNLTDKQRDFLEFGVDAESPDDLKRMFKKAGLDDVFDDVAPLLKYRPAVGGFIDEMPNFGDKLVEHMARKGRSPELLSEGLKLRSTLQPIVKPVKKADGGTVFEKDLQRSNRLSSKNKFERLNAVAVRGLASMLGTYDPKTGSVGWGGRPGLIDEFVGLPSAFSDNAPDWSKEAAARTANLRARVHEMMPDVVPSGTLENIVEAGGEMAGQLPIPAGWVGKLGKVGAGMPKYLKYAAKAPGAVMEYLSPTIHPSVGNYVSGAVAGGLLGNMAEPDMLEPTDFEHYDDPYAGEEVPFPNSPLLPERTDMNDLTSMVRKYGGGGKVARLKALAADLPFIKVKKTGYGDEVRVAPRGLPRAREEEVAAYDDLDNLLEGGTLRHMNDYYFMGPKLKKADGGKIGGAASAIRAIKNAITHLENNDRMSAVRELVGSREAMSSPNVQRILQMLKGPENSAGLQGLRQTVEADTNQSVVPFLAGGGKVDKAVKAAQQVAAKWDNAGHLDAGLFDDFLHGRKSRLELLKHAYRLDDAGYGGDHLDEIISALSGGPLKKAGGGKVGRVLQSFKSVDWKDQLSPETRKIVTNMDAKQRRVSVPDRRLAPQFDVSDTSVNRVLDRRRPYFVKPEDLE